MGGPWVGGFLGLGGTKLQVVVPPAAPAPGRPQVPAALPVPAVAAVGAAAAATAAAIAAAATVVTRGGCYLRQVLPGPA